MRCAEVHEIAPWETLLRASAPAVVFGFAAAISTGLQGKLLVVAASASFVIGVISSPPSALWLDDHAIYQRRRGRTTTCIIAEVVSVSLVDIQWSGKVLFFARADGTGITVGNLSPRTADIRVAIGLELERESKVRVATPEARAYLGLGQGPAQGPS